MKLARFKHGDTIGIGAVEADGIVTLDALGFATMLDVIAGREAALARIRTHIASTSPALQLADVALLAPVERPGKYLAIGMNYAKHVEESDRLGVARATHQVWFNKQTTCVAGPYDPIEPGVTEKLDYEVELGAVIGQRAKHVAEANALDHVFGYVVANDVSARDWQFHTPTFTMGKSFDTHGPIGPWIVTADEIADPQALDLRCYVNGALRQSSNTAQMIHTLRQQIAYLSTAFTLEPGDLIATGTPEGVGVGMEPQQFLQPGDVVRCEIDGIGAIETASQWRPEEDDMAVLGALSLTLEVPEVEPGVAFYTDAGLVAEVAGDVARLRCAGQDRDSIVLLGGFPRKRLHHVSLRADDLAEIARKVSEHGGRTMPAPGGFEETGLWIEDPNGMLIHLGEHPADTELSVAETPFAINAPGRIVRSRRSAILPQRAYPAAKPLRLGHILVFSPDVMKSVAFVTDALGMGLADHAQDVIAFTCARRDSDHHVLAFAKSPGIGFHHASFQVADPDEVGRGGRALAGKAGRGDWGFGRHTIGSNFFHYIQDPWGSWFEYYSDMDHIDDHAMWTPTNYAMEDSLASWGPAVPKDFVHNYELDPEQIMAAA